MAVVASISQQIWDMKYRLKGPANGSIAGEPIDKTIEDTWRRVATAAAAPEKDPQLWADRFYAAMSDFRFLPAGRVIAGAGAGRQVTLFTWFVLGAVPDDMGGIFAQLREAARTMQQGRGIGYDSSTLRPKGTVVRSVRACGPGRLRMVNLSVLGTDAFMQAVEEDAPWELHFGGTVAKVLPARELWDKIMRATYAYAEPGVIFIDRINRRNNLWYCEEIHATNP